MTADRSAAAPAVHLPTAIWALGFVSLLMDVSPEPIHCLLPVCLVSTLGARALTVGLLEGAAGVTALIARVFSGALGDCSRRRAAQRAFGALPRSSCASARR
jgi:hypothetical protein